MSDLFSYFESNYNLLHPSDRNGFFIDIIVDEISKRPHPTVVDIGCGTGLGDDNSLLKKIRAKAETLIGIEPDATVHPPMDLLDQFENCLFEDSQLPDNSVDVAYSVMVMEHVTNPQKFIEKLHRVLKPGGVYIFLTVNGNHYFARITNALRAVKLDEFILKLVRGKSVVEGYHYPVAYKFNTIKQVNNIINKTGLEPARFVFAEHDGAKCYFPGFTVVLWRLLTWKRKIIKRKENLLELICAIKKPSA